MIETEIVVDASAVLALLKNETFRKFDRRCILGGVISAVNFSEVLGKLISAGLSAAEADETLGALDLDIRPFDEQQARGAARLLLPTRHAGLSLGDRACLSLALLRKAPAVTADRAWGKLDIGAEIIFIR